MDIMNLMPQSVRNALRAFYLRRELEQIDLNEAYFIKARDAYQDEIRKGGDRRLAVVRELRGLT